MQKLRFFLITLLLFSTVSSFCQKRVAITFDDPNTYDTPLYSWKERNEKILATLDRHNIKAALFVCGMRINDENGKLLLSEWDNENHLICNHSYSHLYYNSRTVSTERFANDFLKNDSLIRNFTNYTRLFRFPYLKEGNSSRKRDSMRMILSQNGYKTGYVTIDASDWYIDSRMLEELKKNPDADLSVYKNYYILHILNRAHYYDSLSTIILRRDIPHTLLLHHSLLNALFLDDLLNALEENGWALIDAQKAYEDELFSLRPDIEPCGESLIWQLAKSDTNTAKFLRYPGEDGSYEKEPLEKLIQVKRSLNKK